MATQNQSQDATSVPPGGIGADVGYSARDPEPSASAATAAGAVGPGAVAAAEKSGEPSTSAQPERATETGDEGLSHEDRETLRSIAKRVGVDALIRWLQLHADFQ